jgi:hypothetical protein
MKMTPERKARLKGCLQEISNSMVRMEAERDNITAIVQRMADEFEMNKRVSRRLAAIFHKRNLEEERGDFEEIAETYEEVTKP